MILASFELVTCDLEKFPGLKKTYKRFSSKQGRTNILLFEVKEVMVQMDWV